jgi:hypothetical protein
MQMRFGAGALAVLVSLLLLGAGHALADGGYTETLRDGKYLTVTPMNAPGPSRTTSTTGLTLALSEKCGAKKDDLVGVVGQPCAVKVTVTDGSGQAVAGATVALYDQHGVTDSSGQVTLTATVPFSGLFVTASAGGLSGEAYLLFVNPGAGAVKVSIKDRNGQLIPNYTFVIVRAYQYGGSSATFYDSQDGSLVVLEAGASYNVLVAAEVAAGDGYMLQYTGITIPDGAAYELVADGALATPVTVGATLNATAVEGAQAYVVTMTEPSYAPKKGITTAAGGKAVVRVLPGTYEAAVIGGVPAVFASQADFTVGANPVSADFSLTETETAVLEWQPAAAAPPSSGELEVSGRSDNRKYRWPVANGTLHMAPGSYRVAGHLLYSTPGTYQDYTLEVPAPVGRPDDLPTYAAGGVYHVTGGGPWSLVLGEISAPVHVGNFTHFEATLHSLDADIRVYQIDSNPWGSRYWPNINLWNSDGNLVRKDYWWMVVPLDQPGHYAVTTLAANLGPFFPTGTALFARRDFDVVCDGACVTLSLKNAEVHGDKVLPSGSFDAYPSVVLPWGKSQRSVKLNLQFDPAQVTPDLSRSAAGAGALAVAGDTVTWTWSGTSDWLPVVKPQIRFQAVSGFRGPATIKVLGSSTASDQNGPVALTVPQASIGVAKSALAVTTYVDGNGNAPTVRATDGKKTVPGVYGFAGTDENVYDVWLTDVPPALTKVVAMAPFLTTAEEAVTVPESGRTQANDLLLHFGDIDGDNSVTETDLPLLATEFTDDTGYSSAFGSWMDVNFDRAVDIFDLVTAAHNVGQTGSAPTVRGSLTLNVATNGLPADAPAFVILKAVAADGSKRIALLRAFQVSAGGPTTVTLTGVPVGLYEVKIVGADNTVHTTQFVQILAGQDSPVAVVW